MSIVNSISYDQKRRDMLINYRNSFSYFGGIFVPIISFIMFTEVENEIDQFSYMANIIIVLGCFSFLIFAMIINEVKLVKSSKEEYDKYFITDDVKVNSDGIVLDCDSPLTVDRSGDSGTLEASSLYTSIESYVKKTDLNLRDNSIIDFFANAKKNAREGTRSVGGRNDWYNMSLK